METAHNDMGVGFEFWEDSWLLVNVDEYNKKNQDRSIHLHKTKQDKYSKKKSKK